MDSGGAIAFSPPGLSCLYTTSLSLLLLILAVYLLILSLSYCLFLFFLRPFRLSLNLTQAVYLLLFFLSLSLRFAFLLAFGFLRAPAKTLQRCIVKPLGQLVWVSSTAHTAYTPTYLRRRLQQPLLTLCQGELISGQVSCLDAFSTYLFRT